MGGLANIPDGYVVRKIYRGGCTDVDLTVALEDEAIIGLLVYRAVRDQEMQRLLSLCRQSYVPSG